MEVLSGTSSVVALVSLAIQLGDNIKKLCDFWQSMNGASKDIQLIIGDLSILADIAESIGEEARAPRPHTRSLDTSLKALNQCRSGVEELRNIIYKYQPGLASPSPKVLAWTACKFTWQGENVRRFKEALRDTKLTLMLARQESNNWATALHNEALDQALAMIAQVGAKQVRFQNSFTGIETTLHSLLLVRSTTPSTSPSATPTDINNHMNMLRKKIADATSMIRNQLLRSALQEKLESALPYLATDLTRYSNLETTTNAQLPGEPCVIKSTIRLKKGTVKLIESTLIRSIFGTLHFITTTFKTTESSYHNELGFDDKYEIQTTLILHPSQCLLACGLRTGLCMSVGMSSSGLNCSLKSYRAVPDDAAIFDSCRIGDINTVRHLFDHGLASPWDTSSRGLTPLFVRPSLPEASPSPEVIKAAKSEFLRWLHDTPMLTCARC